MSVGGIIILNYRISSPCSRVVGVAKDGDTIGWMYSRALIECWMEIYIYLAGGESVGQG